MHLIQDLARREGEVVLQKKILNGLSSGPGEIEPVEETPVELHRVEAQVWAAWKRQHYVKLIRHVDLGAEDELKVRSDHINQEEQRLGRDVQEGFHYILITKVL